MRIAIYFALLSCACAEATSTAPDAQDAQDVQDAETVEDAGLDLGETPVADVGLAKDANIDVGVDLDLGGTDGGVEMDAGAAVVQGTFSMLSYNVAGLPQALSDENPEVNTPLISPLLNAFDLVLVQEDFAYHDVLIQDVMHPYRSTPFDPPGINLGDGLNRFSIFEFQMHSREAWLECNGIVDSGSDCLTDKGFSVARHKLAEGVEVDIYNLHMDAGRSQDDYDTRAAQVQQLLDAIVGRSGDAPIILAGDTNLKMKDEPVLLDLMDRAQLTDACRALSCPEPVLHDRIFFRSSASLEFQPVDWRTDTSFVDAAGMPLSDHDAVVVAFGWTLR